MIRNEWRFQYKVSEVAEAARQMKLYHEDRARFWNDEFEEVRDKISGEGLVEVKSYDITGGQRAAIEIKDQSMASRLNEAQYKWKEHRDKADTYNTWAIALDSEDGDKTIELDPDDIQFFDMSGVKQGITS